MSKKIIKLAEFIEETKKENLEALGSDTRLNFFRLKKLNQILLHKRSTSCIPADIKTSSTTIRPLIIKEPITTMDLRLLLPDEVEELLNENADRILIDNSKEGVAGYLDTRHTNFYGEEDILFLDHLCVEPEFRNLGIASALINDLKNSAYNNGIPYISGEILPLDTKAYVHYLKGHTPALSRFFNYLSFKTGILKKKAYVDIDSLRKIYTKLGFAIEGMDERQLSMTTEEMTIPAHLRLPKEFTSYTKNDDTLILYH